MKLICEELTTGETVYHSPRHGIVWYTKTQDDGSTALFGNVDPLLHDTVTELPTYDFDRIYCPVTWLPDISGVSDLEYGLCKRHIRVFDVDGEYLCVAGCFQGSFDEFARAVQRKYCDAPYLGACYVYGMYALIESFERRDEPREQYYMERLAKWK